MKLPVELRVESALDEASVVTIKSSESDSRVLRESYQLKWKFELWFLISGWTSGVCKGAGRLIDSQVVTFNRLLGRDFFPCDPVSEVIFPIGLGVMNDASGVEDWDDCDDCDTS